ncbi:circumsporozoite protein-like [Cyclopterus lumpus]|uniref:circumsporozoite protein-like n=1 Tax=Cyclopterus lumpus TaxID=8103 RepID=UPI0014875888|nr:circumsporozoite protein-like [Cyclopterus lumpus]
MAVLWVLSLRMLWISCLLISSVTCLPARKDYGSPYPGGFGSPYPGGFGSPYSGGFGSPYPGGFGSPAAAGVSGSPAAAGGFGSPAAAGGSGSPAAAAVFGSPAATGGSGSPAPVGPMHWSSASSFPREFHTALGANVDLEPTGNDASGVISASGNAGGGSVGTGLSSSNSGSTGGEDGFVEDERPQPVFSNMSNMEPVYTFRSRSGYRNGRRHFSKTRYTPGEMVFPPRPVVERIPNKPVNASPKGGQ